MCSEARGLSGWPRKAARWVVLATATLLALAAVLASQRHGAEGAEPARFELAPNSPKEPMAETLSLKNSARYLDAVALDWTEKKKCGTCHTNYAYLISRAALKGEPTKASTEIRAFFEDRVAHWDDSKDSAKPRFDAEIIATASALALNDALTTKTLHPLTRKALDRIWTVQKPDGGFDWLKCDLPPLEHDDYYGAVFAAVGVGSAPGDYARSESAAKGLEKLRAYLKSTPAPDLHHQTFLLWASTRLDGLLAGDKQAETIKALRALQRPDGGWNLPSLGSYTRRDGTANDKDAASDGYASGLVVYVLRQTGVPANDPALERGVAWLKSHQRVSGRWFTRSLSNDKYHYIANAGTGFAVLAISACEPLD